MEYPGDGGEGGEGWGFGGSGTSCIVADNLPFWQNAALVAEKAALQGQLQQLEGQLGSLQGRAQELLLQSQQAQEHSSRLQVGGRLGLLSCAHLCHFVPSFPTLTNHPTYFHSAFSLASATAVWTFSFSESTSAPIAILPSPHHLSLLLHACH